MTNQRQAFITSVVLHCTAIGLLALFIFIDPLRAEEQPVVLELVTLPDETPQPESPQPPQPVLEQPQVRQIQDRQLPDVNIPEPKVEPKPTPKPEPPKPKMMSLADFDKKVDRRDATPTPPKPRSTAVAPSVNTNIKIDVPTTVAPSNAAANSSLVENYKTRLRNAIELSWNRPVDIGNTWAEFQFYVYPNGSIGKIEVKRSNASPAFIESIRKLLESQTPIGPTPQGWQGNMTITFRLR
ncbi:TonB C-terminal domain-containing protein [Cerasicoccus fimbriatus]|uniref:TonB C-terminal domain-containing protein n=1 Tax=Cerasicoccus fimbriatus TaxID=3014554 RepID=UPI0022B429A4|nr:TonB C-terminal domain-containing protein [Cerasicoccus sp. TK19100]